MKKEKCQHCKKEIVGEPIKAEPCRHATSPNSINYGRTNKARFFYLSYCSKECEKIDQEEMYASWAAIDKNASDSECFEGTGWDGEFRIGKCKITGKDVRVMPLQPSERSLFPTIIFVNGVYKAGPLGSGQPRECTEHFKLRKKYQDVLDASKK